MDREPHDEIDRQILRYHAEKCMRSWVQDKLGLSKGNLDFRCSRMHLRFGQGGSWNMPCHNGHNLRLVGVKGGDRCGYCGGAFTLPEYAIVKPDGQLGMRHKIGATKPRNLSHRPLGLEETRRVMDAEPTHSVVERLLDLIVHRETLPERMREDVDRQIEQLRKQGRGLRRMA